ncbi:hypothetical protein WBO78_28585, partial [Bosea sp. CCNWLW174]|uniref:hypothetical protein n=1 Tax=unclassified Bosea (in: a-proteobacteria) TaxID=2653178 RepID=UPI003014BF01
HPPQGAPKLPETNSALDKNWGQRQLAELPKTVTAFLVRVNGLLRLPPLDEPEQKPDGPAAKQAAGA